VQAGEVETVLRGCMTEAMLEMFPKAPTAKLVKCGTGQNWGEVK